MRILFLTQIVPYPPDAGPKVKTWHVLRYLVNSGHQVTLVSYVRPEEEQHLGVLRAMLSGVEAVPIRRNRIADVGYLIKSQFSGRPFLIERDDLPAMRQAMSRLLASQDVDVIHADQLGMTPFAYADAGLREPLRDRRGVAPALLFDAHNAVWTIVERSGQSANPLLRPVLALESRRLKRYEGRLLNAYHQTTAVAEPDRQALHQAIQAAGYDPQALDERISVIPIAVDTTAQTPVERPAEPFRLMTLGTLHYPPNADGIRWFARQVLPLIRQQEPRVSLTIVGKNPPPDFTEMAAAEPQACRVTGYVPDLRPVLAESGLLIVPVRAGGGMRVRILEGFAFGMPVVTTTVGLEGIDANHGEHVWVADDPQSSADGVLRLLREPALRQRLSENARRLAVERYDWQAVLRQLDAVYAKMASAKMASAKMTTNDPNKEATHA